MPNRAHRHYYSKFSQPFQNLSRAVISLPPMVSYLSRFWLPERMTWCGLGWQRWIRSQDGRIGICWEPIAKVFCMHNSIRFRPNNITNISPWPSLLYHGLQISPCISMSIHVIASAGFAKTWILLFLSRLQHAFAHAWPGNMAPEMSVFRVQLCLPSDVDLSNHINFTWIWGHEWQFCYIDLDRSAIFWTTVTWVEFESNFDLLHCQLLHRRP